jgi:ABC-2 type transport system ATP-binding protein
LVVYRGRRLVLDHLSFSVKAGSVTGLLGPSGSGKTTLMRSIVGVQRVRSGRVLVFDEEAGSASLRRDVGYMTQAPSVYADLTVRENARYFASVYGVTRDEAESAIEEVGLEEWSNQLVRDLSGGQRARASLACALLASPRVLILDEPTVGQDPVLRHDLWERFHALADRGVTLLISSHVMDEAARCDRVLLLREGKILADGSPQQIRSETNTHDLEDAFLRIVTSGQTIGI